MCGFDLGAFTRAGNWVVVCAVFALVSSCSSSSGGGSGGSSTADDDDDDTGPPALVDIYFAAFPDDGLGQPNGDIGNELFVTDGTADGTYFVKDIYDTDSGQDSNPRYFADLNGLTFFAAYNGTAQNRTELWATDGTETGTVLFKDIQSGTPSGDPSGLTVIDGSLYFDANDGIAGYEPWISDGTEDGTVRLHDVGTVGGTATNSDPWDFVKVGGNILFVAKDDASDRELFSTDGSTLTPLAEINSVGSAEPTGLVVIGDYAYFNADGDTDGPELWRTDGTTHERLDLNDDNATGSDPQWLSVLGETLFFILDSEGPELWSFDGAEPSLVMDLSPGGEETVAEMRALNGKLYALVQTSIEDLDGPFGKYHHALWQSDGTPEGTEDIADDIGLGTIVGCNTAPELIGYSNGLLLFTHDDNVADLSDNAGELWGTDGTESGTVKLEGAFFEGGCTEG